MCPISIIVIYERRLWYIHRFEHRWYENSFPIKFYGKWLPMVSMRWKYFSRGFPIDWSMKKIYVTDDLWPYSSTLFLHEKLICWCAHSPLHQLAYYWHTGGSIETATFPGLNFWPLIIFENQNKLPIHYCHIQSDVEVVQSSYSVLVKSNDFFYLIFFWFFWFFMFHTETWKHHKYLNNIFFFPNVLLTATSYLFRIRQSNLHLYQKKSDNIRL